MTGRRWAYVGGLLGGAVSIAANVAHSYVPPTDAPAGWHPHAGAVVGAVFWPVALFVAIEILARVAWPDGRRWVVLRFGGLLPVAAVAAVVSYRHLSGLLTFYGEDGLTVLIGPLAVDGLMVMATGALIATSRARVTALAAVEIAQTPAQFGTRVPNPPTQSPNGSFGLPPSPVDTKAEIRQASVEFQTQSAPGVGAVSGGLPAPAKRPAKRPSAADRVAKAATRSPKATRLSWPPGSTSPNAPSSGTYPPLLTTP
jgi:hypothetical protein